MKEVSIHGYREDLKQYFRSKMEANICRYYNFTDVKYLYESAEFEFKEIKRGTKYYKPDFYLPDKDKWVEVKGFFRKTDITKLKRFKKYYPEEFAKLQFIVPDKYAGTKANGKMIAFLLDILNIKFEEIISYKELAKIGRAFILNWE